MYLMVSEDDAVVRRGITFLMSTSIHTKFIGVTGKNEIVDIFVN